MEAVIEPVVEILSSFSMTDILMVFPYGVLIMCGFMLRDAVRGGRGRR